MSGNYGYVGISIVASLDVTHFLTRPASLDASPRVNVGITCFDFSSGSLRSAFEHVAGGGFTMRVCNQSCREQGTSFSWLIRQTNLSRTLQFGVTTTERCWLPVLEVLPIWRNRRPFSGPACVVIQLTLVTNMHHKASAIIPSPPALEYSKMVQFTCTPNSQGPFWMHLS